MGLPIKEIINYIKTIKKMKKKFGIIGKPIKHSLSPVLHKYWFKKYGYRCKIIQLLKQMIKI